MWKTPPVTGQLVWRGSDPRHVAGMEQIERLVAGDRRIPDAGCLQVNRVRASGASQLTDPYRPSSIASTSVIAAIGLRGAVVSVRDPEHAPEAVLIRLA